MTPAEMLKKTRALERAYRQAKEKAVFVGLPKEKVGGKIYGDGMTIIRVGAIHEYSAGHNPRRSFLRVPLRMKQAALSRVINNQFRAMVEKGVDVDTALGLIGVAAANVSKGAFVTRGYGTWPDISDAQKARKKSSQVLIDKGILRNSITHVVRRA